MEPLSVDSQDTLQSSLSYTDPSSGILFDSVLEPGVLSAALLTVRDNYTINSEDVITNKRQDVINAIDINWNGAVVEDINGEEQKLNTTGDLISWIENKDESKVDKVANKGLSTYDFDENFKRKLDNSIQSIVIGNSSDIGTTGTPSVEATTQNNTTTLTFHKLKGVQGEPGTPGNDGKSAYEVAVENGYSGTLELWLNSLKPVITGRLTTTSDIDGGNNVYTFSVNGVDLTNTLTVRNGNKGSDGQGGGTTGFNTKVVTTLPTSNISTSTIYLVPDITGPNNNYSEFIRVNNSWEKLGLESISDLIDPSVKFYFDTPAAGSSDMEQTQGDEGWKSSWDNIPIGSYVVDIKNGYIYEMKGTANSKYLQPSTDNDKLYLLGDVLNKSVGIYRGTLFDDRQLSANNAYYITWSDLTSDTGISQNQFKVGDLYINPAGNNPGIYRLETIPQSSYGAPDTIWSKVSSLLAFNSIGNLVPVSNGDQKGSIKWINTVTPAGAGVNILGTTIYVPTRSGTSGQILQSLGSHTQPTWVTPNYATTSDITSAVSAIDVGVKSITLNGGPTTLDSNGNVNLTISSGGGGSDQNIFSTLKDGVYYYNKSENRIDKTYNLEYSYDIVIVDGKNKIGISGCLSSTHLFDNNSVPTDLSATSYTNGLENYVSIAIISGHLIKPSNDSTSPLKYIPSLYLQAVINHLWTSGDLSSKISNAFEESFNENTEFLTSTIEGTSTKLIYTLKPGSSDIQRLTDYIRQCVSYNPSTDISALRNRIQINTLSENKKAVLFIYDIY